MTTPTFHCHANPSNDAGHGPASVPFCLTSEGMDFLEVTSSVVRESRFKRNIRQEVSDLANITASEIEVELFAGSVVAEITINPNYTRYTRDRCAIFNTINAAMADGSMQASMQAPHASDTLLSSAATGSIYVPTGGEYIRFPNGDGCTAADDDGFPIWAAVLLALLVLLLCLALLALLWLLRKMCMNAKLPELPPIPDPEPVVEEVEEEPDLVPPIYDPPVIEFPGKGMRNGSQVGVQDFTEFTPSEAPTADPDSFSQMWGQPPGW